MCSQQPTKMTATEHNCYHESMTTSLKLPNHLLLIPVTEVTCSSGVDPLGKFVFIEHAETEQGDVHNVAFMVERVITHNSREYVSDGVFLLDITDEAAFDHVIYRNKKEEE